MVKERDIKEFMLARATANGILARKVVWEGRDSAPDWVLMSAAPNPFQGGRTLWVELKAPGEKPTSAQLREHNRMRQHGQVVMVLDSFEAVMDAVEWLLA